MKFYAALTELIEKGPVLLATVVEGQGMGTKAALGSGSFLTGGPSSEDGTIRELRALLEKSSPQTAARLVSGQKRSIFVERLCPEPELVLLGGGHISEETAALAEFLGYSYTVIDDQEEFLQEERFPKAAARICRPFVRALAEGSFSDTACYVIVTRGHLYDMECLEAVLSGPFGYVGMIGSRQKVDRVMRTLEERGIDREFLDRVHAPIGLDIRAKTPREIALSIVAQLVLHINEKSAGGCPDREMRKALRAGEPGVLVKIVEKKGSAPREAGASMLVGRDGILCGTIGGGMMEYQAQKEARDLLGSGGQLLKTVLLNAEQAASLGMWCGGEAKLYFEEL